MKPSRPVTLIPVLGLIVLGGCALPGSPTTSESGVIPITSNTPAMEVGSTFLYADGAMLVAVPAGPFTRGGSGPDDPQQVITLSDFWIYSTKVTNRQYAYCVAMGNCPPLQFQAHNPVYNNPLQDNDPMVGVNHDQATAYCNFMNARLPTDAEWEKAARGPDANIYPWGNDKPTCDRLNYDVCVGRTTPVNNYPDGRSYYMAFDMAGNAFEWVSDRYQEDYYLSAPTDEPQGPEKGKDRVVRSSAYNSGANQTQAYNRYHSSPDTVRDNLGFRCVVENPTYFAPFCEYPPVYGMDGIGGASISKTVFWTCPEVSLVTNSTCVGSKPLTQVTLSEDPSYLTIDGSCDQFSKPGVQTNYTCEGPAEITICEDCTAGKMPTQVLCPDNFTFDKGTNKCMGKGIPNPGACLPGSTLINSQSGYCCNIEASPSTSDPNNIIGLDLPDFKGLCPTSSWSIYDPILKVSMCIPDPLHSRNCKTERVGLNSCETGGGGGKAGGGDTSGGGGSCPAQSCGANQVWDSGSCSCVCALSLGDGGGCN